MVFGVDTAMSNYFFPFLMIGVGGAKMVCKVHDLNSRPNTETRASLTDGTRENRIKWISFQIVTGQKKRPMPSSTQYDTLFISSPPKFFFALWPHHHMIVRTLERLCGVLPEEGKEEAPRMHVQCRSRSDN